MRRPHTAVFLAALAERSDPVKRPHSMLFVAALLAGLPPTEKKHEHEPMETRTGPFAGCVNAGECNETAHGNVTETHRCFCGAIRLVNLRDGKIERGPWLKVL